MTRWCLLVVVVLAGCAKKSAEPAPTAATDGAAATAPPALPDAAVAVTADAAAAGAAPKKGGLELAAGETLREPSIQMPWIPPAGRMKVTLVDVDGTPPSTRLAVSGEGKRFDVLTIPTTCLGGEHGAELTTGTKNTVVFRCETQGKAGVVADEWLISWPKDGAAPVVDQHWQGSREARDPAWAGGRELYAPSQVEPAEPPCCCSWQDEGEERYERTSKAYCKGSSDHHGVCVDDAKCADEDE